MTTEQQPAEGETLRPTPGGEGYESPPDTATEQVLHGESIAVDAGQGQTHAERTAGVPVPEGEEEGADQDSGGDENDLEDKTNAELQAMLADKGLPTSGTKAELIERLRTGS